MSDDLGRKAMALVAVRSNVGGKLCHGTRIPFRSAPTDQGDATGWKPAISGRPISYCTGAGAGAGVAGAVVVAGGVAGAVDVAGGCVVDVSAGAVIGGALVRGQ